jgi:hypothetical protein
MNPDPAITSGVSRAASGSARSPRHPLRGLKSAAPLISDRGETTRDAGGQNDAQ